MEMHGVINKMVPKSLEHIKYGLELVQQKRLISFMTTAVTTALDLNCLPWLSVPTAFETCS